MPIPLVLMLGLLVALGGCVGSPPAPPADDATSSGGTSNPMLDTGASTRGTSTSEIDEGTQGTGTSMGSGSTTMPAVDGSSGGTTSGIEPTSGTGGSGTSEGPVPGEEVLEHATFDGCNEPLWCFVTPNVFDPAGGAIWMQECFTATLAPPFELIELEMIVRGLAPQVSNVQLEVYAHDGVAGPGMLLGTRPVDVAGLVIGANAIAVMPPIPIDQANVCIGLAAPDPGLAGSLGVSVNEAFVQDDVSFFRLQGGGACLLPAWTDVMDANPVPTGNWCIRATIREL